MMSAPIVVGVDGSDSALDAVRWAATEAARHRVPVRLVHSYLMPDYAYPGVVVDPGEVRRELEARGAKWLAAARAEVRHVPVDAELVHGGPAATLIERSEGARMVVLGAHGQGGFAGRLLGSVPTAVTAHGHCPVVVVRGEPSSGPVVVGVDGSPVSEAALDYAFEAASTRDAPLVAVHAWTDWLVESAFGGLATPDAETVEADERRLLAERLAGRQEKFPDVKVDRVVVHDRPVRALMAHAARAALVVVGSRGRGGFTGMLLGSTSQALVHHAPCPVAVVRPVS
ncbi:universal stress protein [Saccharothrix violaceirubra]|uniref:Nucleotide-binding universal stress UspA family protein n=1 Tax=Saccharothrix violaceirubra TaxID=413306 RepID=A0A7W7T2Y5_9PSEU|nr:universal stress protein [Saccharothrix violaceirubra]MBB4965632.1 nucleotide-binding universal stress UspA family protein [Saccharothrix violaceirubra]